jgi:predicted alpha/beta hydrolase
MPERFDPLPELHFALTADGWQIALHRHRPPAGRGAAPVILCGGYACNRHFMDLDAEYSLARYLAAVGFDAWVVELRGRGESRPTGVCARPRTWTFDDLATFDVPAAIAHVTGTTGRATMWVGHSMGGLVLYAYLGQQREPAPRLRAGVTLASPVVFPATSSTLFREIGSSLLALPFGETVYQRWVLGALWVLIGWSPAIGIGMNPTNVDRAVVGPALRRSLGNVPRAKLQQLARWASEGVFCSFDGTVDYRAALAGVTTPLLLIAGSADRVATPAAVRRALDHLPEETTSYREFGRAHGHSADSGHVDLVLGRGARHEVFPAIAEWLVAQVEEGR